MKLLKSVSYACYAILAILVLLLVLANTVEAKELKFAYTPSASCTAETPCGVILYYTKDPTITEGFEFHQDIGPEGAPSNEGEIEFTVEDNFHLGETYRFALTSYHLTSHAQSIYSNIVSATIDSLDLPQNVTIPSVEPQPLPVQNFLMRLLEVLDGGN
jgi:hypothetical protein